MDHLSIYGGSHMITFSANMANSTSGYCVNHVSECVRVYRENEQFSPG